MIKFFRKIRQNLLSEGKTAKYFKYAMGEIILVVIGILIALQINNWNEEKKYQKQLHIKVHSILGDIREDALQIKALLKDLEKQHSAADHIIPIMESEQKAIVDSLKFILDFNSFTTTPILSQQNNTWDYLSANGILSELEDQELVNLLMNYYNYFDELTINFNNSANPVRLELRELKYELFTNTEHRKFFPTKKPSVPSKAVYESIFNDIRILPLCRYIGSTAAYFEGRFKDVDQKAEKIIYYLETNYQPI
ncbi:DUF6090 family protein [Cellulophaga sp. Hel_I_12]|uniref:DUF6090 family protein n=1 Tax=Cellulophaga sp. Hel_I_12 TaxID=1249972 RepID=UPI000646CAF1|nr:DUF6090 family protein [Cellulophaga sp. Hel_I_12]